MTRAKSTAVLRIRNGSRSARRPWRRKVFWGTTASARSRYSRSKLATSVMRLSIDSTTSAPTSPSASPAIPARASTSASPRLEGLVGTAALAITRASPLASACDDARRWRASRRSWRSGASTGSASSCCCRSRCAASMLSRSPRARKATNSLAKALAIAAAWRGSSSVAVICRTFAFCSASTCTLSCRSPTGVERWRSRLTFAATASEPASRTFVAASRCGSSAAR